VQRRRFGVPALRHAKPGKAQCKGRKDQEFDIIASVEGRLVRFEVKYRALAKPKPIADAELTALGWTVKDLQVPKLFQ
jgi:hypothetical protein